MRATIVSTDASRGRVGVRVEGTEDEVSLRQSCVTQESLPWDACRHGGPPPEARLMSDVLTLHSIVGGFCAPSLAYVELLEPVLSNVALPPQMLASMGIDAWIGADFPFCQKSTVCAAVLDAARQLGTARFFRDARSRAPSAALAQLERRFALCNSAAGLRSVLAEFATCACLELAEQRGVGLKQSDIDPAPSHADDLFEGRQAPVIATSPRVAEHGESIGRMAVQLLENRRRTNALGRALIFRKAVEASLSEDRPSRPQERRAQARDRKMNQLQTMAAAAAVFISAGGVELLETILDSAAQSARARSRLTEQDALSDQVLLAFEVVANVRSSAMATAMLSCRVAALLCELLPKCKSPALSHNALRAVWAVVTAAPPSEFRSSIGLAKLDGVVREVAHFMVAFLSEDMLDFGRVDTAVDTAIAIASGGRELAQMVVNASVRGISHAIPTSLTLILFHHCHEQRAGRCARHARVPSGHRVHFMPICFALEGLYTISLHCDIRNVLINDGAELVPFVDALPEYSDFLETFAVQADSQHISTYLARLRAFTHATAPPMDPQPPFETQTANDRRLMQHAQLMLDARARVRAHRSEQLQVGIAPAVQRAAEARERGNVHIRGGRDLEAAEAYSEAVTHVTGLETDGEAAWALVLALSNRAEAMRRLGRHQDCLEDCTNAWVLLDRFEESFDAAELSRIQRKLREREAAVQRALGAENQSRLRAEQARSAAERRAERRRRARQARVARRELELAEEARDRLALNDAIAQAQQVRDAGMEELECIVCQDGTEEGALLDFCGYHHVMHVGCASIWRDQCVRQQQRTTNASEGPHCPVCRRPI
ncbi:hypothetical protein AB1Y20_012212 [Prymnesium parvum]|uniref:RING-type domain-containing protein n=1 Tax=Prymnesium parvum TaxID=97485 RepID=A0AB34INF7_PRYPA